MALTGRHWLFIGIFILFLLDTSFSFFQHLHMPLEGDLAKMVLPSEDYAEVLKNPLGLKAVTSDEPYAAPNRYFFHASIFYWFNKVPLFLQNFVNPIDSVYLASAIAKTLIQLLIVFLLLNLIRGKSKIWNTQSLITLGLLFPLFQTEGYNANMGVVDMSISYTFGYALAMVYLLFTFILIRKTFQLEIEKKLSWQGLLIPLFGILALLNGPLNGAVVIVSGIATIAFLMLRWQSFKGLLLSLSWSFLIPLILLSAIAIYSVYVGTLNAENNGVGVGLFERYQRLPGGLLKMLTSDLGLAMLVIWCILNVYILKKLPNSTQKSQIVDVGIWILLFTLIYLLLLPLGGYRDYRPDIVRRDSILPILLMLFLFFAWSTTYLIKSGKFSLHRFYTIVVVGILGIYTIADSSNFNKNHCEKMALGAIASSTDKVVLVEADCTVLSWKKILNPDYSTTNAEMLFNWKITDEVKKYYHKE